MRSMRPRVARREDVSITRRASEAIITFHDGTVGRTHLQLGVEAEQMTDDQILNSFNSTVRAMEASAAEYDHIAVEILPDKPQIRYRFEADQWTPRGDVLECYITDGSPHGEVHIEIDDTCLALHEFGRLLTTYAKKEMPVVTATEDETGRAHPMEAWEPDDESGLQQYCLSWIS